MMVPIPSNVIFLPDDWCATLAPKELVYFKLDSQVRVKVKLNTTF